MTKTNTVITKEDIENAEIFQYRRNILGRILHDVGIEFKEIDGTGAMYSPSLEGSTTSVFLVAFGNDDMINGDHIKRLEHYGIVLEAIYFHEEAPTLCLRVKAFGKDSMDGI